jgi:hypothetical protein
MKASLSRDAQRFVDYIWHSREASKTAATLPEGFRPNEFELSMITAAKVTGLPEASCTRLRDTLLHLNWLRRKTLTSGHVAYCIPHESKRRSPKNTVLQTYTSKLTKSLQNSDRFRQISSKSKTLKAKGIDTVPDSPRLSPPRETVQKGPSLPLISSNFSSKAEERKKPQTGLAKTQTTYVATPFGLHGIVQKAVPDVGPIAYPWREVDELLGHVAAFNRELWDDRKYPKLDKHIESNPRARKAFCRRVMEHFSATTGNLEERKRIVVERLKNDCLGNFQDQVERNKIGKLKRFIPSMVDQLTGTPAQHRERKGWCAERGRETMNVNYQTRDRYREKQREREQEDELQRQRMTKSDPAKVTTAQQLRRDFSDGRITLAQLLAGCDELERAIKASG